MPTPTFASAIYRLTIVPSANQEKAAYIHQCGTNDAAYAVIVVPKLLLQKFIDEIAASSVFL
jgi:hypothetical protein